MGFWQIVGHVAGLREWYAQMFLLYPDSERPTVEETRGSPRGAGTGLLFADDSVVVSVSGGGDGFLWETLAGSF